MVHFFTFLKKIIQKAFSSLKSLTSLSSVIKNKFKELFIIKDPNDENIIFTEFQERYLDPKRFQVEGDILCQSYLNTGKTECLSQLLEFNDKTKNILILTNRIKLAKEFSKRFYAEKYGLNCYLNHKKKDGKEFFNRVIIQPESLWKLDPKTVYDLVILDECESVFTQFTSVTMETKDFERKNVVSKIKGEKVFDRYNEFSNRWERIINTSNKLIFCDAFLSNRTIEMYKTLKRKGTILKNTYRPPKRKAVNIPVQKFKGMRGESIKPLIDKAVQGLKTIKIFLLLFRQYKKCMIFVMLSFLWGSTSARLIPQ